MVMRSVIETQRLVLRPLVQADAPAIQQYFPHWNIVQHLSAKAIKWPYPADGAEKFLKNIALPAMEQGGNWYFGITEKDDPQGKVIGVVHLRRDTGAGNRGVWLGEEFQGKGYMKEAVAALNDYAFSVLGFEKLLIKNAEENIASRNLKERTGAKLMGTKPASHYLGGCPVQEVWELTAADWRQYQAAQALAKKAVAAAPVPAAPSVVVYCQPSVFALQRQGHARRAFGKALKAKPAALQNAVYCKPCPAYGALRAA